MNIHHDMYHMWYTTNNHSTEATPRSSDSLRPLRVFVQNVLCRPWMIASYSKEVCAVVPVKSIA